MQGQLTVSIVAFCRRDRVSRALSAGREIHAKYTRLHAQTANAQSLLLPTQPINRYRRRRNNLVFLKSRTNSLQR